MGSRSSKSHIKDECKPRYESVNDKNRVAPGEFVYWLAAQPQADAITVALFLQGEPKESVAYIVIKTTNQASLKSVLNTVALCLQYSFLRGTYLEVPPHVFCRLLKENIDEAATGFKLNPQDKVPILGLNPTFVSYIPEKLLNTLNSDEESLLPGRVYSLTIRPK